MVHGEMSVRDAQLVMNSRFGEFGGEWSAAQYLLRVRCAVSGVEPNSLASSPTVWVEQIAPGMKIDQPGRFFVIIGRATFSAAVSGVSKLDANTNAIFMGEPIASPPNFVESRSRCGCHTAKMVGTISDLYWQNTFAMDYRIWVAPSIYTPPTFAMLKAGRDPAMEAILEYIKQNPAS